MILTRHEQGAGFIAATYGRLTGKTGVCLATLGPGATNFVTAAAYAQLGAMPMMMITGQKPIKISKQGQFQIVDVVAMMKPLTKYAKQIVDGNNIPSRVREAFRLAEEERPGAVHLELPEDIAADETEAFLFEKSLVRRPLAGKQSIETAIKMIEKAKNPILLIGAGANRKLTSKMLTEFVNKFQIPFITTQMGKGVVDERSKYFVGNASLSAGDYLHCAIGKSDLIINVGHDVIEKPPFFMEKDGIKVIHINFISAAVDPVYFPQVEVIGDIANSIWQISENLKEQEHWDFSYSMKVGKAMNDHIMKDAEDERFPVIPQRIVGDIRKVMPSDGIIALDNGVYKIWFARNYLAHQQNTVLLDNALATMGAGLPSAMGANIVYPDKKVIAICGDGGFMMNSQEIETAVRLQLNIVVIVLRDNAYGMIKWKQTGLGFDNWGLDYGNPDFVKYAESYGARGHRLDKTENLQSLLIKCLDTSGVDLVEIPVDYSENEKVLINELKGKMCIL